MRWPLVGCLALALAAPSPARADVFGDATACHALLEEGALEKAIVACDAALSVELLSSENQAITFNNRGRALLRAERYGAAIADFTSAINLAPSLAHPYNNRGAARASAGDQQGALLDFDAALERDPDFTAARFNRARVRHAVGDHFAALEDVTTVLEADPTFEPAIAARAEMLAAAGLPGVELQPVAAAPSPADAALLAQGANADAYADVAASQAEGGADVQADIVAEAEPQPVAPMASPHWEMALQADDALITADAPAEPTPQTDVATPVIDETASLGASQPENLGSAPLAEAPQDTFQPAPRPEPRSVQDFEKAFRTGELSVRDIQAGLTELGYRPGVADGLYGGRTRTAIEACIADRCELAFF